VTAHEEVLIAACCLRRSGFRTFTAEHLTVVAWEMYPTTFGLSGYKDCYPDSNKVLVTLSGKRGLVRRGWLRLVGPKEYELTDAGRTAAAELEGAR
jgi:hypothetical protein